MSECMGEWVSERVSAVLVCRAVGLIDSDVRDVIRGCLLERSWRVAWALCGSECCPSIVECFGANRSRVFH